MSATATALKAMRDQTGTSVEWGAEYMNVSPLVLAAAEAGWNVITPEQAGWAADACIAALYAEMSA